MLVIPIKEGSTLPLPAAEVGRNFALRARLTGVPRDLENVQVAFDSPSGASEAVVPCAALPGGEWSLYASPLTFQATGRVKYRVTARTPHGDSLLLGTGALSIVQTVENIDAAETAIVPNDTYVRNPATGLWHKLMVSLEDGELVPEIEKEGIMR